jgi:hypothetical protein
MTAISYYYTQQQFLARRKDITRRANCHLKPGEHYNAVKQMQGLKKGEHRQILGECVCLANDLEPANEIIRRPVRKCQTAEEFSSAFYCCRYCHPEFPAECQNLRSKEIFCYFTNCPGIHEVDREGFPELSPEQFVEMLCKMNHIRDTDVIRRVVFRRVV